jgi:photosystem II stability/assembly factor-like uncharacterized protein
MHAVSKTRFRLAIAVLAAVLALCTAGGAAASVTVSQSGWAWGSPSPQGNTLKAISFAGPLGYAVGENGTALKTLDGGATWAGLATGTSSELTRVQIVDPSTVVIGSANGCVLRISTDGGTTFTRIFTVAEAGCHDQVQAFSFVSSQVGFLLLRSGSVLITQDGGNTFSRATGVPGTPASSGGGGNAGIDIHFTSPTNGIVFAGPPSGGQSTEFKTSDGGVSWTPVTLPGANVAALHFVDQAHAFAIGPNTLLSSADGGATWVAQPIGSGNSFTSIDCADAITCVLTVAAGDHLVRTTDGGATSSVTTPSSAQIFAAAYSSPARVVGVGSRGATVVSNDGGANFTTGSSAMRGVYFFRLHSLPGGLAYAPGTNGVLAVSKDGGVSWSTVATQTSADLVDAAFASATTGYALDRTGGLQLTTNGGSSWRTLDPGTPRPASAVTAVGANSVLLVGPIGVYRSVAGGRFNPVTGKLVASARLSDVDRAGASTFAFGEHALIRSTDGGAGWTALRLPLTNKKGKSHVAILSVSFIDAANGLLLDSQGRLWRTRNGGRLWSQVLSTGTSGASAVTFSDTQHAFLTIGGFGADSSHAYVLHSADAGATWNPQLIAAGKVLPGGLVAEGSANGFALVETPLPQPPGAAPGTRYVGLSFFFTNSGGDAGAPSSLTLATKTAKLSRKKLRRTHRSIRIDGVLKGAQGGEQIVVSRRSLSGGPWQHQTATAGANGGSFTTTWHTSSSSVFVAQWAGDSGRASLGSRVLRVTVR